MYQPDIFSRLGFSFCVLVTCELAFVMSAPNYVAGGNAVSHHLSLSEEQIMAIQRCRMTDIRSDDGQGLYVLPPDESGILEHSDEQTKEGQET